MGHDFVVSNNKTEVVGKGCLLKTLFLANNEDYRWPK